MSQTGQWQGQQPLQMGQKLSEQEMAYDLLYQEKAVLSSLAAGVMEISHPGLRQVMNDDYLQTGQDQLNLFNVMNALGWYQVKPAQPQDTAQAKQKFSQLRSTL